MNLTALVLADRDGSRLAPLTNRFPLALLPIAGRSLLERTLEDIAAAGVQRVIVAADRRGLAQVQRALATTAAWPLDGTCIATRGEADGDRLVWQLAQQGADLLVCRVDSVRPPLCGAFLEAAAGHPSAGRIVAHTSTGRRLGLELVRQGGWPSAAVELASTGVLALDHLRAYHLANILVARGDLELGLGPTRRSIVYLGRAAAIDSTAVIQGPLVVGAGVAVGAQCEVGPNVVLGNDVVVGAGARLASTVVLDGTAIEPGVDLADAIVWGDLVIRLEAGHNRASLRSESRARVSAARDGARRLVQRALGMLAILLALPLWVICLAASLIANPRRPFRREIIPGNGLGRWQRTPIRVWRAAAPLPLLAMLPRLFAVASGHLQLIGIRPESVLLRAPDAVAGALAAAPLGLVSPARGAGSTEAARSIAEARWAEAGGIGADLRCLLTAAKSTLVDDLGFGGTLEEASR